MCSESCWWVAYKTWLYQGHSEGLWLVDCGLVSAPLEIGMDIILVWREGGLWVHIWLCLRHFVVRHSHSTKLTLLHFYARTARCVDSSLKLRSLSRRQMVVFLLLSASRLFLLHDRLYKIFNHSRSNLPNHTLPVNLTRIYNCRTKLRSLAMMHALCDSINGATFIMNYNCRSLVSVASLVSDIIQHLIIISQYLVL